MILKLLTQLTLVTFLLLFCLFGLTKTAAACDSCGNDGCIICPESSAPCTDGYGSTNYQTYPGYCTGTGACCPSWATWNCTPLPTPTPTPPPGSFSLTNIFTGCLAANAPSVDIYWSTSSNVDHYLVYRWNNGTNQYDEIGNAGTSTSFRDINASQGTTAVYTVVAFNDNGATGPSNSPNNISTTVASCPPASVDLKCNGVDGTASIDNNTSATLSWTTGGSPSSCNASNAWSGAKSTTGGSEATANLTGPNTYTYNISCSNYYSSASDVCSVSVPGPTPTPTPTPTPAPNPPFINSLTINGIPAQNGGLSGRLFTEGGSNTQNPIVINLNASAGSGSIREFSINFSGGFQLAYFPPGNGGSRDSCTNGNFCVLDGTWKNISGFYIVPGSYQVEPWGSDNSTNASWRVTFYQNFGSKTMSTSATVTNTNGLSTSGTF